MFELRVTGFQTVTTEFAESRPSLDLIYDLRNPATYLVDTEGRSTFFHVRGGDKLIVHKKEPKHGDLVIGVIHEEFVLARIFFNPGGTKVLKPMNAFVDPNGETIWVWGVVVAIINNYR